MAKKAKRRAPVIGHACRLRIVRGRKKPHGPNGTKMIFEFDFDRLNTVAVAADMLEKAR